MNKRSRRYLSIRLAITISGLIALLWQQPSSAAEADWAQCGDVLQLPPRPVFAASPADAQAIEISGDVANMQEGGISKLSGNVELQRGMRQLTADHLEYNEAEELIDVQGNVRFWDEGAYASGDRAHVDLQADTTKLSGESYIFLDTHSRGDAGEVVITGENIVTINDADYTTCNPGSNTWKLHAKELELDFNEDVGTAYNVVAGDRRCTRLLHTLCDLSPEQQAQVRLAGTQGTHREFHRLRFDDSLLLQYRTQP